MIAALAWKACCSGELVGEGFKAARPLRVTSIAEISRRTISCQEAPGRSVQFPGRSMICPLRLNAWGAAQGLGQQRLLLSARSWSSEGAAHGVVDAQGPRGLDPLHEVAHRADQQRRYTRGLHQVGDETHGLVTVGSIRDHQREVHAHGRELPRQLRGQPFGDGGVVGDAAVDGEVRRGHATDDSLSRQLPVAPAWGRPLRHPCARPCRRESDGRR